MGKTFTKEELQKILENHEHWLKKDCDGWEDMRANLRGANLYGADLYGADLSRANLIEADLSGADLREANLGGANLSGANLREANLGGANLSGANLYGADLCRANLRGADLCRADLSVADLYGAYLYGADLHRADLIGADLSVAKNVPFIPMACPDEGEFIAWKKCKLGRGEGAEYCIVKLRIPADAKRSSATGRKCRCNKAEVLVIESIAGDFVYKEARSDYDYEFIYKVGETVTVNNFDEDRFNECAPGIHFFINRQEAVDYLL